MISDLLSTVEKKPLGLWCLGMAAIAILNMHIFFTIFVLSRALVMFLSKTC